MPEESQQPAVGFLLLSTRLDAEDVLLAIEQIESVRDMGPLRRIVTRSGQAINVRDEHADIVARIEKQGEGAG